MAIKRSGRGGYTTLSPKRGLNPIFLAAVVILVVFAIVVGTEPEWINLLRPAVITVTVPKPHVVQVKQSTKPTTPTKPTQPTSPTQPPQTFSANPVSIGEKMLGSYWEKGKLYYDGTYYTLLFNLPKGAELRVPFAGTVGVMPSNPSGSLAFMVFPAPNLFKEGAGNSVFYAGNSLKLLVTDGESVATGQVVAIVEDPTAPVRFSGNNLDGDVGVGYGATTSSEPNTYTFVSRVVLEEAFPYVKDLVPGQ